MGKDRWKKPGKSDGFRARTLIELPPPRRRVALPDDTHATLLNCTAPFLRLVPYQDAPGSEFAPPAQVRRSMPKKL